MAEDRYGGSDAITFVATVTIKPEHEEEYLAVAAAMVDMVLVNEPATTLHTLHKHPTEPHTYIAIERYRDAEAVTAHADSPYFGEAMEKLQQCLAKPIEYLQLSQVVPS